MNWPFLRNAALAIERTDGLYLITQDGRRILDAAGGAIVANVGYGRHRVAARAAEVMRDCSYVVPTWRTPARDALVETLQRDWLPAALTRIHITSGGSDAVEAAMKLALLYHAARGEPGRRLIVTGTISYHGTTAATTAASGHPARRRGLEHLLAHHPRLETPYLLRCPLGRDHPDAARFYLDDLRTSIEGAGPENVAAILAEPIGGSSGGALVPPDGYWPGVRALCDEFGLLLIHDEVMTGFGRTGLAFAHQHWPVTPDILVAGKGLAGGYAPIGGLYAAEHLGQALQDAGLNLMFHTFAAHPAACAAAVEVLSILTGEALLERAARQGARLKAALQEALGAHPRVAEVRGRGLLLGIEIVADRETLEPFPEADRITARIVAAGLQRGVFFYGGGTGAVRDIICLGPAFTIGDAEIGQIVDVLKQSLDAVLR